MLGFLRDRSPGEEQRATTLELFFDLVFVFAVTQLSQFLLEHLTGKGALQTLFLLLVVWWAWIYTTWMTNWFDPDSPVVRGLLILVMLSSLFMAIAIPDAFGEHALLFAAAYAGLQIVRNVFAVVGSPSTWPLRPTLVRILWWSLAAGVLWILGGVLDDGARIALWLAALTLDYAGPFVGYWTPTVGRSRTTDWEIESSHFSERFQLFVLIVLGESIVVTGATASGFDLDLTRGTALAVAFLGTAALWWLYFDYVAIIAQRRLDLSDDRGRLARDAYTYLHIPIIAGVIVAAVGGRARDRPSASPTQRGRARGSRGRTRALPPRPRRLPASNGGDAQREASRRSRCRRGCGSARGPAACARDRVPRPCCPRRAHRLRALFRASSAGLRACHRRSSSSRPADSL